MHRWLSTAFAGTVLAALASSAQDPPAAPVKPPAVRVVAFSPDGKLLVAGYTTTAPSCGAVAWEVATGKRLWHSPGTAVTAVSFPAWSEVCDKSYKDCGATWKRLIGPVAGIK